MLFQKESNEAQVNIKSYKPGNILTNLGVFDKPLFLVNGEMSRFDGSDIFEQLTSEQLVLSLAKKPEILIIGTGENHKILDIELTKTINDLGIAVEAMASRQACHTYQVLTFEQRRVSVLIFP